MEEGATSVTVADTPKQRRPRRATRNLTAKRLGHFQLLEPLGHGGMGTVYSAYDLRLDRKVAIKVLTRDSDSPEREQQRNQRLVREAQAMAKLSHPNVVPVYEVGVEDGTVFIAMEYVAGKTLSAWLREVKPAWREIARVFVQAGRGLAAAHEVGIVHRDFKPANVLVDDRGHVRVVDFGVAQVRGVADPIEDPSSSERESIDDELTPLTPSTPLTEQGSLLGTPAYMSPEQYKSATVDARSDQFSFCVALHEALFGKRPFAGRGKTLAENIKAGVIEKAEGQVPGWLTAIVMRGLATEPEKRFPSMTELCAALERDPGKRWRRVGIAAAAAAVLAGGAVFAGTRLAGGSDDAACSGGEAYMKGVWDGGARGAIEKAFAATGVPYADSSAKRAFVVLDEYAKGWVAMRGDACRATRVRREQSEHVLDLRMACLDDRLGELRALTTVLASPLDAKAVEHSVAAVSALTPVAGCADTSALLQAGATRHPELTARLDELLAKKRVRKAGDSLAAAKALVADARAASDTRVLAQALDLQGVLEIDTGDLQAAEATLGEALRRARQVGDADLFVQTSTDLVDALGEAGISTSREALGVARVAEAVVGDTHDPALPIRLEFERADEYMTLAHPETALPILERTLEQARDALGEDHILVFQIQSLYASALSHGEKFDDAKKQYEELIANATRVLGAMHPTTVMSRLMRCRMLGDSHAIEPAHACFAQTLPDAARVVGARDRELLSMRAYDGLMLMDLGKLPEARDVYAAAYTDVPADAWTDKWFIANDIARTLGTIEVELGNYQEALDHCKRAEEATEQKHRGPLGATCVGQALLGLGKPAEALAVLEPLVALINSTPPEQLGVEPAQIGTWRFAYAQALWAVRHQAAPARALATKARAENPAKAKQIDAFLAALH